MTTFATGRYAKALCQRCGLPWNYGELREDGQVKGLRVCPDCWSPKHPQETPRRAYDPVALRHPSPDIIADPWYEVTFPLYTLETATYFGQQLGQFSISSAQSVFTATGTVSFSSATYSASDVAANVTITVTRSAPLIGATAVNYATSDGTATEGVDYTATSGTLNWSDLEGGDKTFDIPILGNAGAETNETINIALSDATFSPIGSIGSAVLTLAEPIPAAPSGLSVDAITEPGSAMLTWTDNSDNEAEFVIERDDGPAFAGYVEIGTAAADATSYTDTTTVAGTTYRYRVAARNSVGTSAYAGPAETLASYVFNQIAYTGDGVYPRSLDVGVDMTAGGLVVIEARATGGGEGAEDAVFKTDTGATWQIHLSNNTLREACAYVTFTATGVTIATSSGLSTRLRGNQSGVNYVAYFFRKTPGFFDVVHHTGSGASSRALTHSLGVVPGSIVNFSYDNNSSFEHGHSGLSATPFAENKSLRWSAPGGVSAPANCWGTTQPTSAQFRVGGGFTNSSGFKYVNFLFAESGNGPSHGSYTGNGSATGPSISTLGWVPDMLYIKRTDATSGAWVVVDQARTPNYDPGTAATAWGGIFDTGNTDDLGINFIDAITGGFQIKTADARVNASGVAYIYTAFRVH